MPAYRLPSPYDRQPLRRRASGLGLALAINLGLLLVLMTLGFIPPPSGRKTLRGIVVDLIPQQRSVSETRSQTVRVHRPRVEQERPQMKPPHIALPVKPSIEAPPQPSKLSPWIEMTREEMAAADLSHLPKTGSSAGGDSEVVGRGPNGEALYAAEWAREPTDAELGGYLPRNAPEGYGLIACRTVTGNRVEDCVELAQSPAGSHLASAVRQAAWQFRVRPPRKGGRPLVGSWVRIRIDYYHSGSSGRD